MNPPHTKSGCDGGGQRVRMKLFAAYPVGGDQESWQQLRLYEEVEQQREVIHPECADESAEWWLMLKD
ncbi:hypothetical protein NDU88_004125 [Pleurodeles waltl]|uniref:Uncharacterized protein n=1 Tax=Pleurodeles waltl TaxID=8319 RepID=A0AAV7KXG6_PLEWA|nr:hypothetical protein NDU88_004125 [Pleurodeles waltl]